MYWRAAGMSLQMKGFAGPSAKSYCSQQVRVESQEQMIGG